MIVLISLSGVRLFISASCEQILGFTQTELLGETPIAAIHPDDRARVSEIVRTLLTGADGPIATYRQQHKDGHWVWLEAIYRLICDPKNGEPIQFLASVRDISRRELLETRAIQTAATLEEKNRLLALAGSLARVGHYRLDLITQDIFWSPEVYAIYGIDPSISPTLDMAFGGYHPEDRDDVSALVAEANSSGTPFSFQARILRPDGNTRWVQANGQIEAAPNGQAVGLVGIFQDITERIENERALTKARQVAEEALQARTAFVSTISHEIRTPLTGVLAACELLTDTAFSQADQRILNSLKQSGGLLASLVDDILVYSKLESGPAELDLVPVDLEALIDGVAGAFEASATTKGLSIEVIFADLPRVVVGDPIRIQRVLSNLLSNAIKFSTGGTVRVVIAKHKGDQAIWHFAVSDEGVGTAPERLEQIFQPFVQADASITRTHGGTGLGLTICRHMVEAMGGRIWAASALGHGSEFHFELPLPLAANAEDGAITAAPRTELRDNRLDVLLVEDHQTNRYLIQEMLKRLGHAVTAVENGQEAVAAVGGRKGGPFDLILMDIQMPVLDGLAATRAIRMLPEPAASTLICAITAEDSSERRAAMKAAGIDEVLAKPIKADGLARLLRPLATRLPSHPVAHIDRSLGARNDTLYDDAKVQELDATLGRDGRNALLRLIVKDFETRPGHIINAVDEGRLADAGREAHTLKGSGLMIGASRLVAGLEEIVKASREGTLTRGLALRVLEPSNRIAGEIGSLLHDDDD